jgi:hypothetical protein
MGMKIHTPDKSELFEVTTIEHSGGNLIVSGKIMGSMPMKAVIRPTDARQGLKMIRFRTYLFLLTFLFR